MRQSGHREPRIIRRRKFLLRLIFLASLFLLGGVFLFRETIFGNAPWDSKRRFSFIVDTSSSVVLLSISPNDQSITVVSIKPDTYMEVPQGIGTYKTSAIYRLGTLQNNKARGGELLCQTVQQSFGVPIEGYIRYDNPQSLPVTVSTRQEWDEFRQAHFGWLSMFGVMKAALMQDPTVSTDLAPFEVFRLFSSIRGSTVSQINIYDLTAYEVVSPISLPDKSRVLRIDPDRLDKVLEGVFQEEKILRENISVGVLNASRATGVATIASRIVTAMGARVVSVGNADEFVPEACFLSGTKEILGSYTVGRLVETFHCKLETIGSVDELAGPYTLELLVGEGYSN